MTVDEQIAEFLKADAGVQAIVGSNVWLGALPQSGDFPAVAYWQVSAVPYSVLDGATTPKRDYRWKFAGYSKHPDVINSQKACNAAVKALERYRGALVTGGPIVEVEDAEDASGYQYDYETGLWFSESMLILCYINPS